MGFTTTTELEPRLIAHREPVVRASSTAEKIRVLGTWMVILGTVRLVCAIADYVILGLESTRVEPMSMSRWSWFFYENNPTFLLGAAWPLLLGLALRRMQWLELLKPGALTFLILSIGNVVTMVADWSDHHASGIAIGSFHVSLSALAHAAVPAILLSLLGGTQLLLEFATAAWATMLAFGGHDDSSIPLDRQTLARRERFGRLAVCTSVAFLVLMVRMPAWTAYLELLNQSRVVREFILRDDLHRIRSPRRSAPRNSETQQQILDIETLFRSAAQAWNSEKYAAAADDYRRLAVILDSIPRTSMTGSGPYSAAQALNSWAWLLATCPELTLRNPKDAVKYAHRAVELWPSDGAIWNTLGVAYYRLGNWEEARSALYQSMELRNGGEGDGFDWFFLAMIHTKLGYQDRARSWYDKATDWSRRHVADSLTLSSVQIAELSRFQVEAAQVLGLPKPEPIPIPVPARASRAPVQMVHPRLNGRRVQSRVIEPSPSVD